LTHEQLEAMDQAGRDRWFERQWAGPPELKPRVYRNIQDKDCWYSVVVENEYRLPELQPEDVVLDIGSHIGAFSWLAYRKGSRHVYAFEIDPWHCSIATVNLSGLQDGIGARLGAVVRGDERRAAKYYYAGAWNSFGQFGDVVPSWSLDDILTQVEEPVRFLKIDAEGAEWPILSTCTKLDRIAEIAGEYHLVGFEGVPELQNLPIEISAQGLALFLEAEGFDVEIVPKSDTDGNFFAKRRLVAAPVNRATRFFGKIAD
jgi:FkbM family methyltransferase